MKKLKISTNDRFSIFEIAKCQCTNQNTFVYLTKSICYSHRTNWLIKQNLYTSVKLVETSHKNEFGLDQNQVLFSC